MLFDRELFSRVKEGEMKGALRFYRWRTPTLSFGRTQGLDHQTQLEYEAKGWQIVRRPTGGGVVLHDRDLCFTMIWRKEDDSLPWGVSDSYCAIHQWLKSSLSNLGFTVESCLLEESNSSLFCFQKPVRYDLLTNGEKIIGGAQFRDREVAIHQGSIQIKNLSDISVFKINFEQSFGIIFQQEGVMGSGLRPDPMN